MDLSRRHLLTLAAAVLPWRAADAAAPALQLPTVYHDAIDPAPYLVSEKYDGVRGHWDGATLRFRSGREVPAPAWFTAALPRTPLDGELWLGRGRFDELSGSVRRQAPLEAEWRAIRYQVFELPGADGPFEQRARRIEQLAAQHRDSPMVAVAQTRVADRAALQRRLDQTVAAGGEGLVLHLASAAWRPGRSDLTMKLKPERDAEAVVVGHRDGQGRFAGQLGALELRTPEGRRFLVGSGFSDAQRRLPPPLGSIVTYRYRELTSTGLPRFATFVRPYHAM